MLSIDQIFYNAKENSTFPLLKLSCYPSRKLNSIFAKKGVFSSDLISYRVSFEGLFKHLQDKQLDGKQLQGSSLHFPGVLFSFIIAFQSNPSAVLELKQQTLMHGSLFVLVISLKLSKHHQSIMPSKKTGNSFLIRRIFLLRSYFQQRHYQSAAKRG